MKSAHSGWFSCPTAAAPGTPGCAARLGERRLGRPAVLRSHVARASHATDIRITISGMRKMQGHEVPEDQVDAWVAEAEAGYDVEQLRKRGRPTRGEQAAQVVPVRFTDEEISSLMQRADREHLNRSEAIRRAVREWTTA